MNKYLRKSVKIFLWTVAIIVLLIVTLAVSLNIPTVQNFVKDKAIAYLKNKTKTQVSLKKIYIGFPKNIVLDEFYIADKKGDTLLYAGKLAVDISLLKLIDNQVEVNNLLLKNVRANVKRINPDTAFNFSFIVDAFAGEAKKPEEETKKDSAATLKFAIDQIAFEDIGLSYRDDVSGNHVKLYLGAFKTKIKTFDLAHQHYVIKALTLNNTDFSYLQQKPLTKLLVAKPNLADTAQKTDSPLPVIEVEKVAFNAVKVNYTDQISTTKAIADVNDLGLIKLKVDLTNSKYQVENAWLKESKILFAFKPAPSDKNKKAKDSVAATPSPLALNIQNIDLVNNQIQFDNLAAKALPKGMDFNHLNIVGLNLGAQAVQYQADKIKVKVKNGSLSEKSGFRLDVLKGDATYSNTAILVKNLIFKTPNTDIDNATDIQFSTIDDLTKHPERVKINLAVNNSTLGIKDATYFSNAIPVAYQNLKIKLNTRLNGHLNNLNIPVLQASGLQNMLIDMSGNVQGLPDVNKTFLDVNIKKVQITKGDILAVAPKKSIPPSIDLPNVMVASGTFKGSMSDFGTRLNLNTDMGNAVLAANLNGPKGAERYQANVQLNQFNVGRLLKMQKQLGKITAKAEASGTGLDAKKIDAKFKAQVLSAYYNRYTYKNLNVSGTYQKQNISINSDMPDSNANFKLNAQVNMAGKYPSVKANLDLQRIDAKALNFSKTVLTAAGLIKVDLSTADADYLNGTVGVTGLQVVKDQQKLNVDTISLKAKSTENENELSLKSEVFAVKLDGKYQLTKVGAAFINQLNKYYRFGQLSKIPDQRLRFVVDIYDSKLLKNFVPELKVFKTAQLSGLIDTKKDSLLVKAYFPQVIYGDFMVDTTTLNLNNAQNKLSYALKVKKLQSSAIALFGTELSGEAAQNNLGVNIFLRDRQLKDKYVIAGNFQSINQDFKFSLDPKKLLLDYEKWVVSPENYIQFGNSGILVNQFQISHNGQSLAINSNPTQLNAPLAIEFKDFQLETLTKFAETDTTLVGGRLNGTANIKDLQNNPKFEANLSIDELRYLKDEFGTLKLAVNNNMANAFEVNASLSGVHDLQVNGFYYTAPKSALDLNINLQKFDLKNIESLSAGQLKNGKGILTGQLTVKGELTSPKILGDLTFKDAGFKVAYVNAFFRLPNEKISFATDGIGFDNFTLLDSLNQEARLNGKIFTENYKDFRFGLDVRTTNFRLINSTAADNELIYGTVFVSSNIKVRGDLNQPSVNMNVRVNKGTKFFFALPADDPSVINQEGIVQFIDADAPPFNGRKALTADSLNKSPVKGINLIATINLDPAAELNVVVDPANGDALKVRGSANLNATIDPSGKVSLTGKYVVTDGNYNLSVGPLGKKEFKLVQGSTIVWTGEPTAATLNLSALYEVDAAPIDLINDPSNNLAKNKLPFQVYLMMKGELMKPSISFRLDLPESQRNALGGVVYTKIINVNRDENELNKQVFALLALNRFIANNPFESLAGGGGGATTLARSSVSKLLTEQLNNLASSLIKGVDLNFGVNSSEGYSADGAMQQKTDLEIGFSKKLLSDRLTVSVGSSFGLQGANTGNQNSSNIAGNVNLDYALSADGRYRLRAYRKNDNESVIEGQIIETGLGFSIVVDYNKFKEIFQTRRIRRNQNVEQKKPKNEKAD